VINWENYRRTDGSIDLLAAYSDVYGGGDARIRTYLTSIEEDFMPINSRQAAAIAIVTARALVA
jgi:hypothetical protein